MTPEQQAIFERMRRIFPGLRQAAPPMSTPSGTSSFYRQFGIGPNTRLSEFGRTGPRTTMPNFRAAIQPLELTDEGRDFFRRLQQGYAAQADEVADDAARSLFGRGIGFLARRVLGPLGVLMPDRMAGATFDDIQLSDLPQPEAMDVLPGGGFSVPLRDSGSLTPAEDLMLEGLAPSPTGMPGVLELSPRPDVPPPPSPVPSVQSGFGFEGYDSAAVSESPDVGILAIDILGGAPAPPDMPVAPGMLDAPARDTAPPLPPPPAVRELAPSVSPRPQMRPDMPMYEVQSGDYLGKIAQDVGMSLPDLLALNPQIENPDLIFPGQMLNLG